MKTIFLLPPSEGKNKGWINESEQLSFIFDKPSDIALNATPRDLHCKDKRYREAQELNTKLFSNDAEYMSVISRYSGVMFHGIGYDEMSEIGQKFFDKNFFVISGMYGLVKPDDMIANYKLPISTKGLYKFWGDSITQAIIEMKPDRVVSLLPQAYARVIDFDRLDAEVIRIAFMKYKEGSLVNMAHGVKKVKWEWIKNICENSMLDYTQFKWDIVKNDHEITIQIIHQ